MRMMCDGLEKFSALREAVSGMLALSDDLGSASVQGDVLLRAQAKDGIVRLDSAMDIGDGIEIKAALSGLDGVLHKMSSTSMVMLKCRHLSDEACKAAGVVYDAQAAAGFAPVLEVPVTQEVMVWPEAGKGERVVLHETLTLPTRACQLALYEHEGDFELVSAHLRHPSEGIRFSVKPPEGSVFLRDRQGLLPDVSLADLRLTLPETVVRPCSVWADLWVVGHARQPNRPSVASARREMLENPAWHFEVSSNLLRSDVFLDAVNRDTGTRVRVAMPHPLWRLEYVSGPQAHQRFCLVRACSDVHPKLAQQKQILMERGPEGAMERTGVSHEA